MVHQCTTLRVQNKHIPDKRLHLFKASSRGNPATMTLQINTFRLKVRRDRGPIYTALCHQLLDLVTPCSLLTHSTIHAYTYRLVYDIQDLFPLLQMSNLPQA